MSDIVYMFVGLALCIIVLGIVAVVMVLERLNDRRCIEQHCDCHRRRTHIWNGWI